MGFLLGILTTIMALLIYSSFLLIEDYKKVQTKCISKKQFVIDDTTYKCIKLRNEMVDRP